MSNSERQRGFTLIELLVVLAILALMAGVVAFNLPPARDAAKREAERFAALLDAASSQSIVDGQTLRVEIRRDGFSFSRLEGGEWRAAEASTKLGARTFSGIVVEVVLEDKALRNEPKKAQAPEDEVRRIVLDPIGAIAPFTADFTSSREHWRVARGADGSIKVIENAQP